MLTVQVAPLRSGPNSATGALYIRRQQVEDTLCNVVEKALRKKLPKLVSTDAAKRILLLERQHMILLPKQILGEIERQRPSFPDLARVDEIWILETPFYGTDFGGTHLRFELYENDSEVKSLEFNQGKLTTRFENGEAEVIDSTAPYN